MQRAASGLAYAVEINKEACFIDKSTFIKPWFLVNVRPIVTVLSSVQMKTNCLPSQLRFHSSAICTRVTRK